MGRKMNTMYFLKKEKEKKTDRLRFTTFKCKNPLQKVQVHSPKNEYRGKRIPLGKIWKYFLSFLRSYGELWLQQTWEMTVVTECLGKGLFYAKELADLEWSQKSLCVSEVEQFVVFFWQRVMRFSRCGLQLFSPLILVESMSGYIM